MKSNLGLLLLSLLAATVLTTGCVNLKTRSDIRGENAPPETATRQTARTNTPPAKEFKEPKASQAVVRADELDDQLRNLNGRVDAVENQLTQLNASATGEKTSVTEMAKFTDQKFGAYEEELKKLEAQVAAQSEEINKLKSAAAAGAAAAQASAAAGAAVDKPAAKGRTPYDEAEELFNAKKWREAIVAYQKYRDANPKGKMYADSTYKIGVSFQELKMKDEARAFFEEVVSKFPNSKEAKKAAFRMKSLK